MGAGTLRGILGLCKGTVFGGSNRDHRLSRPGVLLCKGVVFGGVIDLWCYNI